MYTSIEIMIVNEKKEGIQGKFRGKKREFIYVTAGTSCHALSNSVLNEGAQELCTGQCSRWESGRFQNAALLCNRGAWGRAYKVFLAKLLG